ncbi:MAG: DUF945 domain-containing protein [bacterium]|nr:DUF945 domain-containing protein [bacterium]
MNENQNWNPSEPMKVLADEPERWHNFREPVSFDEAAEMIAKAAVKDGSREDFGIASLKGYVLGPRRDGVASLVTAPNTGREHREIPLRSHAFGQLCGRLGAPASYVRGLPTKLQMACLNYGIQNRADDAGNLVRMAGGEARAMLSHGARGYAPLDNDLVVETLRGSLQRSGLLGETRVRSVALGRTCSLRLTFPEHDAVVKHSRKVNDIVEVGLDVLNGEVGNRSVSITPLAWRLVCLNGMRRADRSVSTRLRHVGDPARLRESFQDAVPLAIAASRGLQERMNKAVDQMIDGALDEILGLTRFGLSKAETRDVARDVMAEQRIALPSDTKEWGDILADVDISAFDVLNGVTHIAQAKGTDRRVEMEEAAAQYLYRRVAA